MTYVAVVFDAILPEISNREFSSNDNGDAEDHHEPDAHDSARGMIQRQGIVENGVLHVVEGVQVVHADAVKVKSGKDSSVVVFI